MKLTKKQLQAALDGLAKAICDADDHRTKIMDHCMEVYGLCPGDVDNDLFIDSVDGGCGRPSGMTVEAFDKSMKDAIGRR